MRSSRGMASIGRLELSQRVTNLGSLLVVLALHRVVQVAFELFTFGKRALPFHFLLPVLQALYLGALRKEIVPRVSLVEFAQALDAGLDFLHCRREFFVLQML